jgi:hypothetical protein
MSNSTILLIEIAVVAAPIFLIIKTLISRGKKLLD